MKKLLLIPTFVLSLPAAAQTLRSESICSRLSFSDVTLDVAGDQKEAFELALNVTSSYEGSDGWSNLSNNDDKQGVSLGLLQWNLGQGTLQPILLDMVKNHAEVVSSVVSPSHLASLQGMLSAWSKTHRSHFADEASARLSALNSGKRSPDDRSRTEQRCLGHR